MQKLILGAFVFLINYASAQEQSIVPFEFESEFNTEDTSKYSYIYRVLYGKHDFVFSHYYSGGYAAHDDRIVVYIQNGESCYKQNITSKGWKTNFQDSVVIQRTMPCDSLMYMLNEIKQRGFLSFTNENLFYNDGSMISDCVFYVYELMDMNNYKKLTTYCPSFYTRKSATIKKFVELDDYFRKTWD